MKDPSKFWGKKSDLAKKSTVHFASRRTYVKPTLMVGKTDIFEQLLFSIAETYQEEFIEKGFIDLKRAWNELKPQLENIYEDEEIVKQLNGYTDPWQSAIMIQGVLRMSEFVVDKVTMTLPGYMKKVSSGDWMITYMVNTFDNKFYMINDKWMQPRTKKKIVDGELTTVEVPQEGFQYHRVSGFINDDLTKRITAVFKGKEKDESEYMCFIGDPNSLKLSEYKGKPSHNFNFDDFIC